jgi:starch synthase (maltosyl-transferring)
MPDQGGRRRVVITNVSPQVEAGAFPAKVLINQPCVLHADIFADGHDAIAGTALIRHESARGWEELPMTFAGNDRWEARFVPRQFGTYQFTIKGWVDHFATWRDGFIKKHAAGQDMKLELAIGAGILREAIPKAKSGKSFLTGVVALFEQENVLPEELLTAVTGAELEAIMRRCGDTSLAVRYPQHLQLDVEREKAGFSTWYELFPRSASSVPGAHGSFRDVENLLPRISQMGFDVLYLPPIHPIGRMKRKGRNNTLEAAPDDPGSPWAVGNETGGHKALHPELGTLKDFKQLIETAGRMGIEIAMDIAFQCAPDHPWVQEHPSWFRWRPDGTVQFAENPPKKYEDILPIYFETDDWQALWDELRSVFEYWIGQGIKIFRVDNPHTKSFYFWEWVLPTIRKDHPDVIFLAEAFTRPRLMERLAKAGFTQSYSYFTWRNTKAEIEAYLTELTTTELRHYMRPNFWPNTPDILPPELTAGGENKHIIRLILAATLSSNYGLYGPVYEFCLTEPYPGKEEYIDSEKYEIRNWDWTRLTKTGEVIAAVNAIRKTHAALQQTEGIRFLKTSNEHLIAYVKCDPVTRDTLLIIVNLDPDNVQEGTVQVSAADLGIEGSDFFVRDLLNRDRYRWSGHQHYIRLNPFEMPAHIFSPEAAAPQSIHTGQ